MSATARESGVMISPCLTRRGIRSAAREGVGLLHELVAGPGGVALRALAGRLARGLPADEIGMGGDVREALPLEIRKGREPVPLHEGQELLAHRLDALVTELHDTRAHLDGVRAEED